MPATVTFANRDASRDRVTPLTQPPPRALLVAVLAPAALVAQAVPRHPPEPPAHAEVKVLIAHQTLEVGDVAPALLKLEWLRGEPVALGKDRIVVVEFFSSICPLSRLAIPVLSKLQRRYQDQVAIAGVVPVRFERKREAAENFVAEWKDRIGYAVAWDGSGRVTADWFDAAQQTGYPAAFVVDAKSRVAWIGSPLEGLDDVLARLTSGAFDLEVARQVARLEQGLRRAQNASDRDRVLAVTKQWIALEPARATPWISRFVALADDLTAAHEALLCTRQALHSLAPAPAELARFCNEGLFAVADATDCHALGLQTVREAFAHAKDDAQLAVAYFSALAATGKQAEAEQIGSRAVALAPTDSSALVALARHFIERRHGKRFVAPALAAIARALAAEPDNHQLDLIEFGILADVSGDDQAARQVGERIIEKAKRDEVLLNQFAWDLLDKPQLCGRFDRLALAAALATAALDNGGHWMYVDTLARAKFVNGDVDKARELQRRAVKDCDEPYYMAQLRDRLKMYEKAAASKRK